MQIHKMNLESWIICGGRIILGTSSWTSSGHPACLFVLCMCECARARTCLMYCVHYFSIYPSRDTTLVIFTSPPFQMYLFHNSHRIIICSIRKFIYMIYNCLQTVYVFGTKVLLICFLFFKVYVNYILGWKKGKLLTCGLWRSLRKFSSTGWSYA